MTCTAFERFCIHIWDHDGMPSLLDTLQTRYGFDPTFLLFSCWFAQQCKGPMTPEHMHQVLSETLAWREGIIDALERMVHDIHGPQFSDVQPVLFKAISQAKRVRYDLLNHEADCKPSHMASPTKCLCDACRNIIQYAAMLRIRLLSHDAPMVQMLCVIFSQLASEKVMDTWVTYCKKPRKLAKFTASQLHLDLC